MPWLDLLQRDPVPWLLDPENPSVRMLVLRDIFGQPPEALETERDALLEWPPLKVLIEQGDWVNLWGRASNPYYGGAVGTFGTLYTLTQLSAPPFRLATMACENLMREGRLEDGRFAPPEGGPVSWLCYTALVLQILHHFGFDDDPRTEGARLALVHGVLHEPQLLEVDKPGAASVADQVKALAALLALSPASHGEEHAQAIQLLTKRILGYEFAFEGRERSWLQLHYPRYHESDLAELCHVLAHAGRLTHPHFQRLLRSLVKMQTPEGRWIKKQAAPGTFQVERIGHPSRWLTFEAVHTLILVYGGNVYAP